MSEPKRVESLNPAELLRRVESLQRQVAELERQNAELRAENARLQRRQQRQAAPFSKETRVAEPKRPGRKPGQGRFTYRPAPSPEGLSEPAIAVPVTEPVCPHCGGALVLVGTEVASITDLPAQPRPVVRQYQVAVCHCQACGRSVRGRHPDLAADQSGATAHRLGPRVLAAAQSVHYQQGVPVRRVPAILDALSGIQVTQSALTQDALRCAKPRGRSVRRIRACERAWPKRGGCIPTIRAGGSGAAGPSSWGLRPRRRPSTRFAGSIGTRKCASSLRPTTGACCAATAARAMTPKR